MGEEGKYNAYILTIVADSDYVKNDLSKLSHNTYQKQDADFSGVALYFTPRGKYLEGYAYKNGQIVAPSTTQQAAGSKVQSVDDNKLKTNDIVITCVDWYDFIYVNDEFAYSEYTGSACTAYNTDGGGSTSVGNPNGSSSNPGTPPPTQCAPVAPPVPVPNSVDGSHLKVNYLPPPSGCPDHIATQYVVNNLTDPCSKNVLNRIINQDLNGKIANIINDVFGTNDKVNITYKTNNSNDPYPAQTVTTNPNSTTFDATVTLNMAQIGDGSQEYKATVMVHEALHAYMNYNNQYFNNQLKQHQEIAQKYVNDIKVFVKALYPSLPDNDAYAMILNGIADVYGNNYNDPNYQALLAHYQVSDAQSSFLFYKTGFYGTSCTPPQ